MLLPFMQAAECLNTENSIIYKRKACNFAIQTQSFYENFFLSQFFSFSASSTVKYANEIQKTKLNENEKENIDDYIQKVC